MNRLELADAYELMKKGVVFGFLVLILGVLFGMGAIFSPVGFAVWLAALGLATVYPQYLIWRSFKIIHRNFQRSEYKYATYLLFFGMVAVPIVMTGAAVYILSLIASQTAAPPPGGDPALQLLLTFVGWLLGLVYAVFWYKVWSALEEDSGESLFAGVAWVGVLSAFLSFWPLVSGILGIVFLILLYFASDRAEKSLERLYLSNQCGADKAQATQ
nr:hypothetical protein [Pyrobaculum sp.]